MTMSTRDSSDAFPCPCRWLWLSAAIVLLTQAGCTSAITTAAMREALSGSLASLATPLPHAAKGNSADDESRNADDPTDADADVAATAEEAAAPAAPKMTLDQAVERAVSRLSAAGQLDAATQATLLTMLESTSPEDWPAAIDAFTASLEANRPPRPTQPAAAAASNDSVSRTEPIAEPAAKPAAEPDALLLPAPTEEAAAAAPPIAAVIEPVANFAVERRKVQLPLQPAMLRPAPRAETMPNVIEPEEAALLMLEKSDHASDPRSPERKRRDLSNGNIQSSVEPEDPADEPAVPALAVRNPCFVSKVKAWGVVDRFPSQAFRRGQDVIVYFELEQLSCRSGAAGHSTSIDTAFRLVGPDGEQIRTWTFEPVDETCLSQRRDYFARYFLRMPDNAPAGPCRLEFIVTDRLANASTQAHLDLEIADRE